MFAGSRKAVFVNGCFWHLHDCPAGRVAPASNRRIWSAKREATAARDAAHRGAGGDGLVRVELWECQLKDPEQVLARLDAFLGGRPGSSGPEFPAPA